MESSGSCLGRWFIPHSTFCTLQSNGAGTEFTPTWPPSMGGVLNGCAPSKGEDLNFLCAEAFSILSPHRQSGMRRGVLSAPQVIGKAEQWARHCGCDQGHENQHRKYARGENPQVVPDVQRNQLD